MKEEFDKIIELYKQDKLIVSARKVEYVTHKGKVHYYIFTIVMKENADIIFKITLPKSSDAYFETREEMIKINKGQTYLYEGIEKVYLKKLEEQKKVDEDFIKNFIKNIS